MTAKVSKKNSFSTLSYQVLWLGSGICPPRTIPLGPEEREKVKEMHDEEVIRAADRNVDLVYHSFKDDFTRMQKSITEGLTYCLTKSKGKMAPQVSELQRQNDMVCQSIAYTHKQGIGNELENSKRQEAYVEYKKQMEELVSRVAHLVGMAQQYY